MFTVFLASTLEGWADLAYAFIDAEFAPSVVYFVLLILLANFFLMNASFGMIYLVFSTGWEQYQASLRALLIKD